MQILHIITGLGDGGAEAVLYRLCKFDNTSKHVVISLQGEQKYGSKLAKINIPVYTLNLQSNRLKLTSFFKLYKLIRHIKPDVVQTWMQHADLIGGVVARLAGIKNIFWGVHSTFLVKDKSSISTILTYKINVFLSHFIPKKIIYCAEEARKAQERNGFAKKKGVVIYNGYDKNSFFQDNFLRSTFRDELSISKNIFLVGFVGRYDPHKDLSNLIGAFSILKQLNFKFTAVMVGSNLDYQNSNLVNEIESSNVSNCVHLVGIRKDIPSVMNGIDLFVLSSKSEAFPNVLNEAMLCGTPCVTTNVGDAAMIVGNSGWVVESENPHSLANAISNAAEEKSLENSLWENRKNKCRARIIDNFSIEKMTLKYKKEWKDSL
jgi:glycosyltransferase involved in cell wall biosynthesis